MNARIRFSWWQRPQSFFVPLVFVAALVLILPGVSLGETPQATAAAPADEPQSPPLELVARDPAGHGLLCRSGSKTILLVEGSPAEMGRAHGTLLAEKARKLTEIAVYVVGAADTLHSGVWFLDRMKEIHRRTVPHIPERFLVECDALSKAAGVTRWEGRYANLFPERFHCSGFALRGKATRDGRVLHARVLDYIRDMSLQEAAAVAVFMPDDHHAWMTLGYAGFVGTVTAMNEKGLAVGEMGGRGEGDWDGLPMTFLLREIMERASTVSEALEIVRNSPRTCEYYYVFSDKNRDMIGLYCTPDEVTVLKPGQQHSMLPEVPEDVVMISGRDRAEVLGQRIRASYGQIGVREMIEMIKRPVAMSGNLHNAVFRPETLDMWFADAGRTTLACDEPYAHCNLGELIEFYRENIEADSH
jgi:hypothetical protein